MPVVASIPSPPLSWASFHIGPLTIHTYALCILAGIVAAIVITERRLRRRGVAPGTVLDIAFWVVPLGIVGARIYHVLTHGGDYFYPGANLWNVFAIWDGGNALYGSVIGGVVGILIGCRRRGIRFWSFADAMAPGMLVAQAIGRLGNWFNHELYGLPTTLPWGLQIESTNKAFPPGLPAGTLFQPLFLYEIVWNLIGVGLLLAVERFVRISPAGRPVLRSSAPDAPPWGQWGRLVACYFVWYGLGRSWLEAIRIDPTSDRLFTVPANVWASLVLVAVGLVVLTVQARRHREAEASPFTRPPIVASAPAEAEPAAR